ncbi:glucosaminidase domain-containing protein [Parahaliea aestuarii]|uniref:Bax protein n=1 Tax=Parahaliea aestuarii TaxID=1852021 RepID=A0A5C8ZYA9_9GAMM|nr:glucosaminidase domain-containing protein [Parahaliea aestuarii]TXS93593.1 Bax protein [Parahaliea aestuarii]
MTRKHILCTWLALLLILLALLVVVREPRFPAMPDLTAIEDVGARKQAFYDYLLPIVRYHNARIRQDRERLLDIAGEGAEPGWSARRWLRGLSEEYEVEYDDRRLEEVLVTLQRRVDVIPADLALAQAAVESGWGRSRFALEANNLFGQRCYEPGCGLAPKGRESARFEVLKLPSISEAIRRYMNNLNTHERYRGFRVIREQQREQGMAIQGEPLVSGLVSYSERGDEYLNQLLGMLRRNRSLLERVDEA